MLIAPAMPDPSARKSERKFGLVRSATCGMVRMSRWGGMRIVCWRSQPNIAAVAMAARSPNTWSVTPREAMSGSSRMLPTLAEMAGPINGATTIAPMMVAAESSKRPVVAMIVDSNRKAKNVEFAGARSCARAYSSSREIRRPGNRSMSAESRWETTVSVGKTIVYESSRMPASTRSSITVSTPLGGTGNWTIASKSPRPTSSKTA
jgi:hypothetical protein